MKRFSFLIITAFILAGCTGNVRPAAVGVVDLPVVVRYAAQIIAEKNGKQVEKKELLEFVNSVTEAAAKERRCSVILNKTETVIFYDESIDITADVISEINKRILMNSKSGK